MTGFGRAEAILEDFRFVVEAKSINHRYLDARFRLPPAFLQFEGILAQILKSGFSRGSFEIFVRQMPVSEAVATRGNFRFSLDQSAAVSFAECCKALHDEIHSPRIPSIESMVMTGKIFVPVEDEQDPSLYLSGIRTLFEKAMSELSMMRAQEGKKLGACLARDTKELCRITAELSGLSEKQTSRMRTRLDERIKQWNLSAPADPQRLDWEIAYYAERSDITEELDRLGSHLSAFQALLDEPGSLGRKLDFLTQEMSREINTIGSKSDLVDMARLTVEGKTIVEKLREQVQNVE